MRHSPDPTHWVPVKILLCATVPGVAVRNSNKLLKNGGKYLWRDSAGNIVHVVLFAVALYVYVACCHFVWKSVERSIE